VIDGPGQHPRELRRAHTLVEGRQLRLGLGDRRVVVFARTELEQHADVVDVSRELLDRPELLLEARPLPVDRLRLFLVVPKTGRERLLFEGVEACFQLRDVKGAPLAP